MAFMRIGAGIEHIRKHGLLNNPVLVSPQEMSLSGEFRSIAIGIVSN